MAIPFKKYGYDINPVTQEIKTPQIYLVTKRLKKLGQLTPFSDFNVAINEVNVADEISFTYYKYVDGQLAPLYDKLQNLSVIQIEGVGFFEVSISEKEDTSVSKSVVAVSLGIAELSQITNTLEINTDTDIARPDYDYNYPTVFYREITAGDSEEIQKKKIESSLLHRVLSQSPHYQIGHVDTTLWMIQRTFSWSDTDIVSILNEIAEEVNCVFSIEVTVNEEGNVVRTVSAYDLEYCEDCYEKLSEEQKQTSSTSEFRTIINGVCQNCGESSGVKGIGEDSGIFISTFNNSDEITKEGDKDSIKNCLKVTGGDDLITATVEGLNMSASGKVMSFSSAMKNEFSPELYNLYDRYCSDYAENQDKYAELLENQYNVYDIIQYLQSGKLSTTLDDELDSASDAVWEVINGISSHYHNNFYISDFNLYGYSAVRVSIGNSVSMFLPKGFNHNVDIDEITTKGKDYDSSTTYTASGTVKIYDSSNRDDCYFLHFFSAGNGYITIGEKDGERYSFGDTAKDNLVRNFSVKFVFGDVNQEDYRIYVETHLNSILAKVDLTYDNEKQQRWDKYSYDSLKGYFDGYQTCIDTLDVMISESTSDVTIGILEEIRTNYLQIQKNINSQMIVLQDQIFAMYSLLGDYSAPGAADFVVEVDGEYVVTYLDKTGKPQAHNSIDEIWQKLTDPNRTGGYSQYDVDGNPIATSFSPNHFIGTKPYKCKECGSTNVVTSSNGNLCKNCSTRDSGDGSEIYTYEQIVDDLEDFYDSEIKGTEDSIVSLRAEMQKRYDMKSYFIEHEPELGAELYNELCSFIREDIYNNSNYTSDGLSNAQLLAQAKELWNKAKQELGRVCMDQYTITTPLSSIVAQNEYTYNGVTYNTDYSKFKVNNFVRVKLDNEIYKMRISSIQMSYPPTDKIQVTFTNVTRYDNGEMSDIANIIASAASLSTTVQYMTTQAENGQIAYEQFETWKNDGLDSGLKAVKTAKNVDVVIDEHGILARRTIPETGEYSPYQLKIINRNLVMTDNDWQSASMAIGLGEYEGELRYGVWADVLVGNIIAGQNLKISDQGNTIIIDGNGIHLDGGLIDFISPIKSSDVQGLDTQTQSFIDAISGLSDDVDNLQAQIDGDIITWFYNYEPLPNATNISSNAPASNWTTRTEQIAHEGDIFYNSLDGSAYRYVYDNSTNRHYWTVITDEAIAKALAAAYEAQDTADHKRRVFYTTPYPPYDKGDLWSQGSDGDLMICVTAKTSNQSYADADWSKATKYTDDTAITNFITNTYGPDKIDLSKQIDGKARAWYQNTDPSLTWDSTEDHIGDLWYNTNNVGTNAQVTFIYQNGAWQPTNIPKAVFDQMDGIATIYVTYPDSPDLGDLLIPNADFTKNNVTYKAKKVYRYNGANFEEINYTDDTAVNTFINGTYKTTIESLQQQIDGKAETYYQSSQPHNEYTSVANNEEYNSWIGDLWYNTDTQKSYIYTKTANGTKYNYSWKEIDGVPDSVYDKIDGKSTIYVTWPANAETGDLLVPSSNITRGDTTYYANKVYRYNGTSWEPVNYIDENRLQAVTSALKTSLEEYARNTSSSNVGNLNSIVADYLGLGGQTLIEGGGVISPYIGGGYSNIQGKWKSTENQCQVISDPQGLNNNNYVFAIKRNNENVFYVTPTGNAGFSGDVTASSFTVGANASISGIKIIDTVSYAYANSSTTARPSDSSFSPTQNPTKGMYLWTKTTTKYRGNDYSDEVSYSCAYVGNDGTNGTNGTNGTDGTDGISVTGITNYYLATDKDTGITTSTTGWNTDPTTQKITAAKPYLWNYEVVSRNNGGTNITTTPVIIGHFGENGEDGNDGCGISQVTVVYNVSSSYTIAPSTWYTNPPELTSTNKYLWICETTTYTSGDPKVDKHVVAAYGDKGDSATQYDLIVSHAAINKSISGTYNPTSIVLSAKSHAGTNSPSDYSGRFKIETTTDNSNWTTQYTSSANESSKNYTIPSGIKNIRCSLYLAGGTSTLLDQQSIPIVSDGEDGKDGKDAYTVLLTNEAHTFAGTTSAAVPTSVTTHVVGYKGNTQTNTTVGTITGTPTGMTATISNNETKTTSIEISVTSAMVTKNGVLTIPVTIDGNTFNLMFSYALALTGSTGAPGLNSATVILYQRSASTPSKPSSTLTYTFSTGVLSGTLGSWTQTLPSGTNPCYMISASACANMDTDTISSSEWSNVVKMVENGSKGDNGYNQATIYLYQRAVQQPSKPSANVTYTFSTGALSSVPAGWSRTIPTSNDTPCWVTIASVISRDSSATVTSSSWTDVTKLVEDGTDGDPATQYDLIVSHAAVNKDISGVYNPASITLTAKSHTGSNSPTNYSGRFKIETSADNTSWTTQYTSSANESSKNYTIPSGIKNIRCSLYLAGGTSTLLDQQTVPIVTDGATGQDGKDAYTVILTNESHTFAGSTSAALSSEVVTSVIGYKGATQVATTVGTITGLPTGMSVGINNNTSTNTSITITVTTSMTTRNGTLTIPVTVDGKKFNKIFSYSLALVGNKGDPGVSIAAVRVMYASSTSSSTAPSSSSFSSTLPTLNATYQYVWTRADTKYDNESTWTLGTPQYDDIITSECKTAVSVETSTTGITIHPLDNNTSYLHLSDDALDIATNGIVRSHFGKDEIWLGGTSTASGSSSNCVFKVDSNGNAFFNGAVTATSLTLGNNVNISSDKISGLATVATSGKVSDLTGINNYVTNSTLSTTLQSYVTNSVLNNELGDLSSNSNINTILNSYATTSSVQNALSEYAKSTDLPPTVSVSHSTTNGVTTTNISVDGTPYTTYSASTSDGCMVYGFQKGTQNSEHTTNYFKVSSTGLLEADNAVIHGKIYASEGEFTGKVTSGEGEIGGWIIDSDSLSSEYTTSGSTVYTHSINISNSLENFGIFAQRDYNLYDSTEKKYYKDTWFSSFEDSGIKLSDYLYERDSGELNSSMTLTLSFQGIRQTINGSEVLSIDREGIYTNDGDFTIGAHLNNDIIMGNKVKLSSSGSIASGNLYAVHGNAVYNALLSKTCGYCVRDTTARILTSSLTRISSQVSTTKYWGNYSSYFRNVSTGIQVLVAGTYLAIAKVYLTTGFTLNDILQFGFGGTVTSDFGDRQIGRVNNASPYETREYTRVITVATNETIFINGYNQTGARGTVGSTTLTLIKLV